MKKHYEKSASATSRWLNCNQSIKLSRGAPRQESSYAIEGTKAHDIAEHCLVDGKTPSDFTDDAEVIAAVQEYLDEIASWRVDREILVEHTERTMVCLDMDDFGGTSDHYMVYREGEDIILHCFDYKHGVGVLVGAENNLQVLSYFAIIGSHFLGQITKYRATIVQPRAMGGDQNSTWECTAERVAEHFEAVKAVDVENGSLKAGDWCRWCPAITACPEVQRHAIEVAQETFDVIRDDADRLLEIRQLAPAIKSLLEKIDDALVDQFRQGKPVPGHKVVERLSNRQWNLSDEQLLELFKSLKVPKRIYVKKTESVQSPTQVLKQVKSTQAEALEQAVERRVTGYKVVPESDKGTPIELSASEIFTEL